MRIEGLTSFRLNDSEVRRACAYIMNEEIKAINKEDDQAKPIELVSSDSLKFNLIGEPPDQMLEAYTIRRD